MNTKFTAYQATPTTAGLIETLRQIHGLRNSFYTSLRNLYGEKQGEEIYNAESTNLDALEQSVSKHLFESLAESFGTLGNPANVI